MMVSIPVMIMSLEEGKYIGEMPNSVLPLPRLKSFGMYVQGTKADETGDDYSCNDKYEYLQR
jgi:hypothetical protein